MGNYAKIFTRIEFHISFVELYFAPFLYSFPPPCIYSRATVLSWSSLLTDSSLLELNYDRRMLWSKSPRHYHIAVFVVVRSAASASLDNIAGSCHHGLHLVENPVFMYDEVNYVSPSVTYYDCLSVKKLVYVISMTHMVWQLIFITATSRTWWV